MAIKKDVYEVVLEYITDLLGTQPKDKEVYRRYLQSKIAEMAEKTRKRVEKEGGDPATDPGFADGTPAVDEAAAARAAEELSSIQTIEDRGWTGFFEDAEGPFLLDYMVKGFLCEAARRLKTGDAGGGEDVKQLQDKFKGYVFLDRRKVRLPAPDSVKEWGEDEERPLITYDPETKKFRCERPLRAQTAQGPRITVVRSDVILAGARIEFGLTVLRGGGITRGILEDVLSYGEFQGMGQWRTGGWGRFKVVKLEKVGGDADAEGDEKPAKKAAKKAAKKSDKKGADEAPDAAPADAAD